MGIKRKRRFLGTATHRALVYDRTTREEGVNYCLRHALGLERGALNEKG